MCSIAKDIGIDLGTASVLVYVKGKGVVLNEPSVVAIDKNTGKLLKVGAEAQAMLGRTPGNIVAIRPLREGVISDYDMTERMLREFLRKVVGGFQLFKPRVIICVPSGITEVEERAVIDAGIQAGARRVYLIEEPVAAAIGAGIDITQPDGHFIIDIGGGTSDIAVISLSGVVESASIKVAGDQFNEAVVKYMRRKHNLLVGERTAEKGYQKAIVYQTGGKSEAEEGGGVCQVASTIYTACLYADLKVTERAPHMFTVTYVQLGMDATIYWGSLDYKFVNSTDHPLRIDASVSGGYVHIKLMGTTPKDRPAQRGHRHPPTENRHRRHGDRDHRRRDRRGRERQYRQSRRRQAGKQVRQGRDGQLRLHRQDRQGLSRLRGRERQGPEDRAAAYRHLQAPRYVVQVHAVRRAGDPGGAG